MVRASRFTIVSEADLAPSTVNRDGTVRDRLPWVRRSARNDKTRAIRAKPAVADQSINPVETVHSEHGQNRTAGELQ
jgi:hypothetical protein